ncbi:DBH-like monooxygenase protein 2 homolog [Protopterus annectens]|uniref:DBH-like monooxygenase protein 2 homolog n=1 Tax=Protopterus annectens TaxID=7888 RepID=UPI001CFB8B95|nr:DBH-like monooxygenase protein 2 homolog [Protopterus annectens]
MTVKYIFACLLMLCRVRCEQVNLRFSQYLDKNGEVLLSWDLKNTTDEITMELKINTTGWIGLGLSRSGTKNKSDMVIGGVEEDNSTYFFDAYSIGNVRPWIDMTQNYNLLSLTEENGFTCMRFSRKLQTCDPEDMDITARTESNPAVASNLHTNNVSTEPSGVFQNVNVQQNVSNASMATTTTAEGSMVAMDPNSNTSTMARADGITQGN